MKNAFLALAVASAPALAKPGFATQIASVPQIAYDSSAYVQQLPRNARPWVRRETRSTPAVSEQQSGARVIQRDFILDFGARGFEMRLPSVREGIRILVQ